PQAEAFLLEAARRSRAGEAREGFRAYVRELYEGRRERDFAEVAARRRGWLLRLLEARDAGALWDASPPFLREAYAPALSACPTESCRSALASLERERPEAAEPREGRAPEGLRLERLLARAGALPASALEAAAERAEALFSAQPQMFVGLLEDEAVAAPLLEAAGRSGVDPYLLAAVAFQEGYYVYADALARGGAGPGFDSAGPMGLDSFPDLVGALKRSGDLRADFDGYTILEETWRNEAGHLLRKARFASPAAALEAMAALIRAKQRRFLAAAGAGAAGLSTAEREAWTYVYYSFGAPGSQLARGLASIRRPSGPAQALYYAQRVAATAAFLRDLRLLE
ncbi:MAG: hypothetical protein HY554_04785, partial [Elusimicrobia bacterium]|nr:hypothetical protein [Elusimicrobiota bacterium]